MTQPASSMTVLDKKRWEKLYAGKRPATIVKFGATGGANAIWVTEPTYAMNVDDFLVVVDNSSATQENTILLPPVVQAKGNVYTIYVMTGNASFDLIVDDAGDDANWVAVTFSQADTLTYDKESMAVYSDGDHWYFIGPHAESYQ